MGNTESIPTTKVTGSVKTSGKVFGKDESKLTCDRDTYSAACVEDVFETIDSLDKTVSTDSSTLTDAENATQSMPNPTTNKNSSPESDVQQKKMWEEVASKYHDILHREYRMLNLPSYPVSGGNAVYLYYVPVIINPQFVPQKYDVYDKHRDAPKAVYETGTKKVVVHFSDHEKSHDNCMNTVKEEPLYCDQIVEKNSLLGRHIEDVKERFRPEYASCKTESKQCNGVRSLPCSEETTVMTKVENNIDTRNTCCGQREDIKNERERDNDSPQNSRREDEPYNENIVEAEREGYIRIFKGYTIEYHPLNWGSQGCFVSELDRKRAKKIQDLKKRLAEQEEELEKLKLQQSADVKDDVYRKGNVNGCFQQKFLKNEKIKEFQFQNPWKFLKEFPSTEIHYFPSGERKTSPPRRNSRKQAVPRKIEAIPDIINENAILINSEVNSSVRKKKRKSAPFPPELNEEKNCEDNKDKQVLRQENPPKRAKPSKKVRGRRKRRKIRQGLDETEQKRVKLSLCKNNKDDVIYMDQNECKARDPHDVTQDEFLSIFRLLRKREQQYETKDKLL